MLALALSLMLHVQDAVTVTVNGKPADRSIVRLDGGSGPARSGDVLTDVWNVSLVLGSEKTQAYRTTDDGRVLLNDVLVGVSVATDYQDGKRVVKNPLAALSPDQIRTLRGIALGAWDEAIDEKLKNIDPECACIIVRHDAKLSLPEKLRYLQLEGQSDARDLAELGRLKALRYLTLEGSKTRLDATLLLGCTQLRHLRVHGHKITNASKLESLTEMRSLNLAYTEGVADVGFARMMPQLRTIDVRLCQIRDLSGLSRHATIASIMADSAPIEALPEGQLPALATLRIMSTALKDEAVAAFAKVNPACRILHRWESAFHAAAAGADRIRVRNGGTCRRRGEEKTLFEIKDAAKIRELIASVRLDEARSGFHCMCCGEPSVELYKGDELVLTLAVHHGQSLRWPDGWPGDALLSDASADAINKWLADNGVRGPLDEHNKEKKRDAAWTRRLAQYRDAVGAAAYDGILAALRDRKNDDAVAALTKAFAAAPDRAAAAFALIGCHEGSWNQSGAMEEFAKRVIGKASREDLRAAVAKAATDTRVARGVALWIFNDDVASLDEDLAGKQLADVGKQALTHPRDINRRRTLRALGTGKGDAALALLRAALAGEFKPRPLPGEDEEEPGGMVEFRPGDSELPDEATDAHWAALILARRGDKESLPAIRKLADAAQGATREKLAEAVQALER